MKGFKRSVRYYKVGDGPVNYRVHFIGSGYESVTYLEFKGVTNENVFELAKEWYVKTHQTFHYNEFEREEWIEPTNPVFPITIEYCELEQEEECFDTRLISYLADSAIMQANEAYKRFRRDGLSARHDFNLSLSSILDVLYDVTERYYVLGITKEHLAPLTSASLKIINLRRKLDEADREIQENWKKSIDECYAEIEGKMRVGA